MKSKMLLLGLLSSVFMEVAAQVPNTKIGSFDEFSDIGSPKIKGSASYNEPSQSYHLTGSGNNIWFGSDSFSFLSKNINGDFIIQTQVKFIGTGHEPHRKAGLMIRSSAAPDATVIACTVHGDGLTSFQYRKGTAGTMKEIKLTIKAPDILQLEKKGNTYTMSVAHFGDIYQAMRLDSMNLGNDVIAGLFICAHTNNFSEEAEFSNTRIFNVASDNLIQYKEFLGSALEIMDISTGERQVIASDKGSIQAPNWTPDGKSLIINKNGLLYNFDINSRTFSALNTDFAIRNNNDYVLSFDGKQIGISNQTEDNGKSVVYTLPVTGGVPKRITTKSPSYLHGWSPDNQFLIYTGERYGDFNIYKIPKDGGKERQLTNTKGLNDGSEYSADGKYIYFCSTRTGKM